MSLAAGQAILAEMLAGLETDPALVGRVRFTGEERWPSCFAVTELASAAIASAALMVGELAARGGTRPDVGVDARLASLWFKWSIAPQGWKLPAARDAVTGDYPTRDGWLRIHANAPHHRAAALAVLGCEEATDAVAAAVAGWSGFALENAIVAHGGCAAEMRSREAWAAHPQGQALAAEPLLIADTPAVPGQRGGWSPRPGRPLAGVRVLDLTRVLAGPIATRFLAGYGAQVLRIDPPGWDEGVVIPEVMAGKRGARLDLRSTAGIATLRQLIAGADVMVHGYRSGALGALGLGAAERQALRPGLVDVSLDAYGHSGPWERRRGFDSLVQMSCGIAAAGMAWRGAERPVPLPVQALDHATGYLMAAAAVRGLLNCLDGWGPLRWRLSLARTAGLLCGYPAVVEGTAGLTPTAPDYAPGIEQTAWGPALRLKPAGVIVGSPFGWDLSAARLGTHPPAWAA